MRQDKDRSGKWLLTQHGDSILRLAGITGFTAWKAVQPETVAPRRLPDGLLEVQFPGRPEADLFLIEIETYPGADADRQILEDLETVHLVRGLVPEALSIVLRPKGNQTVTGSAVVVSRRGSTRLGGSWSVVRLWELQAEDLFAAGDVGLVPWIPLTQTDLPAEVLIGRCKERIDEVTNARDRTGLLAVTYILSRLAFPNRRLLDLFGGSKAMLLSPAFDEIEELITERLEIKFKREATLRSLNSILEARFRSIPEDVLAQLKAFDKSERLDELIRVAATCPSLEAFASELRAR